MILLPTGRKPGESQYSCEVYARLCGRIRRRAADAHAPRGTVTLIYAVVACGQTRTVRSAAALSDPSRRHVGFTRPTLLGMVGCYCLRAALARASRLNGDSDYPTPTRATFAPITFTVKPDEDINLAELVSSAGYAGVVTVGMTRLLCGLRLRLMG